jgi:N-acetylmuramoyl-L-alanine amidase
MIRLAALLALALMLAGANAARAEVGAMPDAEVAPDELQCMALNIYWEANRSSELDLRAVAHVTFNRAGAPGFPGSVCDVVTQGGERPLYTCQFQWWCDGRSDQPTDLAAWRRALSIAERVLSGQDVDLTDGALFFHNSSVTPSWSQELQRTISIGDHIFYRY